MKFEKSWTDWIQLQRAVDESIIPPDCGAYSIRTTNRPLSRVAGPDPNGILDIGETTNLSDRLWQFWQCATNPDKEGHMAGWRFSYLNFKEIAPLRTLEVRWCKTSGKHEAYVMEAYLLDEYVSAYKELPPLNYKFNWALWEEQHKRNC